MNADRKKIEEILGNEFVVNVVKELGIENDPLEVQAEILDMIGLRIFKRVTYEIHKVLPEAGRNELQKLSGSGDLEGLFALLSEHVEDPSKFIYQESQKEFQKIKTRANEIEQGVL